MADTVKNLVEFRSGLAATYNAATKNENTFYYTTDDKQLYIGDVKLSNAGDLAAAVARIETNEGKISANEGDIATLRADLNALIGEGETGSISSMLAALEAKLQANIDTVDGKVEAEVTRATGAEATLQKNIDDVNTDLGGKITALETKVDNNESDIEGKFTTLEGRVAKNESDIAGINTSIEGLGAKDDELDGKIEALGAKDEALQGEVDAVEEKVATLIGEDANKSVRTIAAEELAAKLIPEDAGEALDTLQEIADWIQDHPGDAAAMNTAIGENADAISALETQASGFETSIGENEAAIAALQAKDEEIQGVLDGLEAVHDGLLSQAKTYTDDELKKVTDAQTTVNEGFEERITANADAITAINDAESGILAQAQAKLDELKNSLGSAAYQTKEYFETDAQTKASQALTDAKAYTDTEVEGALTEAKSYADGVGTSTLTAAKDYTDEKLTWQAIA